jgi:hypothetical protein
MTNSKRPVGRPPVGEEVLKEKNRLRVEKYREKERVKRKCLSFITRHRHTPRYSMGSISNSWRQERVLLLAFEDFLFGYESEYGNDYQYRIGFLNPKEPIETFLLDDKCHYQSMDFATLARFIDQDHHIVSIEL